MPFQKTSLLNASCWDTRIIPLVTHIACGRILLRWNCGIQLVTNWYRNWANWTKESSILSKKIYRLSRPPVSTFFHKFPQRRRWILNCGEGIAKGIMLLLIDKVMAQQMGKKARELTVRCYDWNSLANRYSAALKETLVYSTRENWISTYRTVRRIGRRKRFDIRSFSPAVLFSHRYCSSSEDRLSCFPAWG